MRAKGQVVEILWFYVLWFGIITTSCLANDVDYLHDLNWQEKTLQKHFPSFTHPATSEHILEMVRWTHNSNAANKQRQRRHAQRASELYRNPNISKMASNDNDGQLAVLTPCWRQILKLSFDISSRQPYAQYVADSFGRPPSGYLRGDYLWLGKYYECKGQRDDSGTIVTKMCLSIITDTKNSTVGLYLGTCLPDICSEAEISAILELKLNQTSYATVFCPDEKPFTSGDIAAICIFSILAFFVLVGTVCETVFISFDMYYVEENRAHEARKRSLPAYLLLCFSMIKNTKALMNTERKESNIAVLDGIRFLSMAWVILGHVLFFSLTNIDNVLDVLNYTLGHIGGQALINGTFSVDSFFFLSGLLVTYLAMRQMCRSGSLNIPVMYLLRYLRLTPTLVLVMLFSSTLFMRLGEEPIYEVRNAIITEYCADYWWTNILYINNLYPANFGEGCISWVWYLANDWQFFLLSPLFIYLLYRYPIPGLVVMGAVLTGSIVATGALASKYEVYPDVVSSAVIAKWLQIFAKPTSIFESESSQYKTNDANIPESAYDISTRSTTNTPAQPEEDSYEYFRDIYARPWCRIGAYLIGMAAGYILYATNKKIKMHLAVVISLWVVAFATGLGLIYGWWGTVANISLAAIPPINIAAFYEAIKRPIWALCLMWMTIACTIGYGGPINAILSWNLFIPLSRLTFCAYLIHPLVIFYMYTAREVEAHFRVNIYIYYYLSALVLSYSAAYLLHVLVEAPFGGLTKVIFYTPEGKKPWYAIFNINVKPRIIPLSSNNNVLSTNRHSRTSTNSVEMSQSLKQSGLPPPYSEKNEKKKIVYENPVEVVDEIDMEATSETDSRTAL